jgi:Cdc6-like AAA superfamily ATPase
MGSAPGWNSPFFAEGKSVARSDLVIALVRAVASSDQKMFLATTRAIIAEARSRQQHALAERLEALLDSRQGELTPLSTHAATEQAAFEQSHPALHREDLIFPTSVWASYEEILQENQRRDLLRSFGLEPRHRILLTGAPGTGKTSLASLLATELMLPLLQVNYSALFGSLLGETSQQLQRVLDFAAGRSCVLLLDEFDSLGKTRDDPHEIGEVKRVLNFLLVKLDLLPSHVIVIAATNRPDALDDAIWRRFENVIDLPAVTASSLDQWIKRANERSIEPFGVPHATLKGYLRNMTFAELEFAFQDIQRQFVLNMPHVPMKQIVSERLRRFAPKPRAATRNIRKHRTRV